jgi:hypothetical protein
MAEVFNGPFQVIGPAERKINGRQDFVSRRPLGACESFRIVRVSVGP